MRAALFHGWCRNVWSRDTCGRPGRIRAHDVRGNSDWPGTGALWWCGFAFPYLLQYPLFCVLQGRHFPGLIPIIFMYLDIIECDDVTRAVVEDYMELIVERARGSCASSVDTAIIGGSHRDVRMLLAGNVPTFATWMRKQVTEHPAYKHDSVVSQEVAFDVLSVGCLSCVVI